MHVLFRLGVATIAALALTVAPASAQSEQPSEESSPSVACDPQNPPAGSETECTATGFGPATPVSWEASFTDGSTQQGQACVDPTGTAIFRVPIPGEVPVGGYQLTVTGTSASGEEAEASTEGLITPGGGGEEPSEGSSEGSSEAPSEEPSEGGSEDASEQPAIDCTATAGGGASGDPNGAPGGGDDGFAPAPSGGVDTGAGGTADDGTPWAALFGTAGLLAVAGAVIARRRRV